MTILSRRQLLVAGSVLNVACNSSLGQTSGKPIKRSMNFSSETDPVLSLVRANGSIQEFIFDMSFLEKRSQTIKDLTGVVGVSSARTPVGRAPGFQFTRPIRVGVLGDGGLAYWGDDIKGDKFSGAAVSKATGGNIIRQYSVMAVLSDGRVDISLLDRLLGLSDKREILATAKGEVIKGITSVSGPMFLTADGKGYLVYLKEAYTIPLPEPITGITTFTANANYWSMAVLGSSGAVWAQPSGIKDPQWQKPDGFTDSFVRVAGSMNFFYALTRSGEIVQASLSKYEELMVKRVPGLQNIVDLCAPAIGDVAAALRSDGTVWVWDPRFTHIEQPEKVAEGIMLPDQAI